MSDEEDVPKRKAFNLKSFVIATLRSATYRYPMRNEALKAARVDRGLYKCASCQGTFKREGVVIDHREPVVDVKLGFTTWDDYINRMFCDSSMLDILCEQCHDSKSLMEREMRMLFRKQRKEAEELANPKPKKSRKKTKKLLTDD